MLNGTGRARPLIGWKIPRIANKRYVNALHSTEAECLRALFKGPFYSYFYSLCEEVKFRLVLVILIGHARAFPPQLSRSSARVK